MLNVVMLSVTMLRVVMLNVIVLNVIVLNVVAHLQDCEHPSTDQNLGQSLASKAP